MKVRRTARYPARHGIPHGTVSRTVFNPWCAARHRIDSARQLRHLADVARVHLLLLREPRDLLLQRGDQPLRLPHLTQSTEKALRNF